MVWIIGLVVLILLVVSAGFRKFAGIFVLIAVIGGVIYWQYQEKYQENEEKQSKTRIKQSELLFEDVSLINTSYGSPYMVGRITNNSSQYTLKEVQLKLTFRDCDKDNKNCIIVAEDDLFFYINIPPKQARDFKESVYLYSDLKIKGKMVWDYKIEFIKAE